jgi:ribosomal protein S18 acetylase RimI-like enzyme
MIRTATLAEAAAVARAHAEAHWETYEPLLGTAAKRLDAGPLELAWRRAFRDHAITRVAEADGEVVGVGAILGETLEWLYLRAAHRGRGLGRAMLADLLSEARARDIAVVKFNVHVVNTAAARFYERAGARLIGRQLIRAPDGDWEDLVFEIAT